MPEIERKRYRREVADTAVLEEAEEYVEYIPVKKRREQEKLALLRQVKQPATASGEVVDNGGGAEANISPKQQGNDLPPPPVQTEKKSLLSQAAAARKGKPEETEEEKLLREEKELMKSIAQQKALRGVKELAKVALNQELMAADVYKQSPLLLAHLQNTSLHSVMSSVLSCV